MSPVERRDLAPQNCPLENSDKATSNFNTRRFLPSTRDDAMDFGILEDVTVDLKELEPYLFGLESPEGALQAEQVCTQQEYTDIPLDTAQFDIANFQVTMPEEGGPVSPGNWEDFSCTIQQQHPPSYSNSGSSWCQQAGAPSSSYPSNNKLWTDSFATYTVQGYPVPSHTAQSDSQCVVIKKEISVPCSNIPPTTIKTEGNPQVSSCQFTRKSQESVNPPQLSLTQHDEKKEKRKAQNRRAAAKLRVKKKKEEQELLVAFKREESRRKDLEVEIANLQENYDRMQACVRAHLAVCPAFQAQMNGSRQ